MSNPTETTSFDLSEITPRDAYKLTTGLVVPRPIGWIGSVSASGVANLAPYSFFNLLAGDPPHVGFSAGTGRKDSLANVREVPEFTVNIVTIETVEAMNASSASLAHDEDEFDHVGLTKAASTKVTAPRVAEATASMECRVTDIIHIGRADGGNHLVIGEIVMIHVANRVLDGTRIDAAGLAAVGRHAGTWYSSSTDLFSLPRPD